MIVYQVQQAFYNPRLGVEGKFQEYLEMDSPTAEKIGNDYLKPVSRDVINEFKQRGIKPRKVVLQNLNRKDSNKEDSPPAKMIRGAKNKMVSNKSKARDK